MASSTTKRRGRTMVEALYEERYPGGAKAVEAERSRKGWAVEQYRARRQRRGRRTA